MRELDVVVLTRDRPDDGLRAGDVGAVILVHQNGAGYEVEFVGPNGQPRAVVVLTAEDLRPAGDQDIARARSHRASS